jgi:putative ABC transport system permease protein
MTRISLISLWMRRRRLAGTAMAVILGVAFLSGTLVLGDTLRANFDRLFAEVSAGTDVVVRNATAIESDVGADDARGPIDQSLLDTVRNVDGVATAEPQLVGYGSLIGRDGDAIGGNGPPRLAGSWISTPELNPYRLVEGRAPAGPNEVVVNRGAAEAGDLELGDTTSVQVPAPVEVTIVGIATFGDADGVGETTWTAFDLESAQRHMIGGAGRVSAILASAEQGVGSDELTQRVEAALPDGVEAITGGQLADERTDEIARTFLDMLRTALVVFAGIALVVATLSITNTFSITVAQRSRELALLRAVGASRRQVRRSVTLEALGLGGVAAGIGVVAGLGVAQLLKGVFDAFGGELPAGGLEVDVGSLAVAFLVGVVVTLVAAQSAARRASRVAPVEVMRQASAEAFGIGRRRTAIGLAVIAVGMTAGVIAALSGTLVVATLGAVALLVGTLVSAPAALSPVADAIGRPLRRLRGVNGLLAQGNVRRSPRRSAATATALLVGVAVVSLFTVFTASLKSSLDARASDDFGADLAVATPVFGGELSSDAAGEMRELNEIESALGLGGGAVVIEGDDTNVTATAPAKLQDVAGLETVDGSLVSEDRNSMAIDESTAEREGWAVGDEVELGFVDAATETVTIEAIYRDNAVVGPRVITQELWEDHNVQPTVRAVLLSTANEVSLEEARQAVEPFAERLGGDIQDREEYASAATEGLDMLLGIVYVLLALAIVIALLGIGNTMSLAVHERRGELGLLRAVGQTRRQARAVLRLETAILSSFGTSCGLLLGGFLGWVLFATVSEDGGFALPATQIAAIAVLGALAGALAARRPARRAARLPILDAIASE